MRAAAQPPQSRRSAGLRGARARRRRQQLRSFCPRFCRRRGPAPHSAALAFAAALPPPPPARASTVSSGARAVHESALAGLVASRNRGRQGPRPEPLTVRQMRQRAGCASTHRAPPKSQLGRQRGHPAPAPPRPFGAAPSRTARRQQRGRVSPRLPRSLPGSRVGRAEGGRGRCRPRPATCCLCSRRAARSCRQPGRSAAASPGIARPLDADHRPRGMKSPPLSGEGTVLTRGRPSVTHMYAFILVNARH
ncbi:hypothetical protein GHT09_011408 [Marmota monax]|uniref:Uncharacterized protein n=1 Tax=Marmota monax TaxID=9995 RepID=A0A834V115_MARMO|nr:hypothetical protein GHT09_011408 [Marmota monax]